MRYLSPVAARLLHRLIIDQHYAQAGGTAHPQATVFDEHDNYVIKPAPQGLHAPAAETAARTLADAGYASEATTPYILTVATEDAPLPTDILPEAAQALLDQMLTRTAIAKATISDWLRRQYAPDSEFPPGTPAPLTSEERALLGRALAPLAEAAPGTPASTAIIRAWMSDRPLSEGDMRDAAQITRELMPTHFAAVAPEAAAILLPTT